MTFTPSFLGDRGYGTGLQYYHHVGMQKNGLIWMSSMPRIPSMLLGRITLERTGQRENRYFGSYRTPSSPPRNIGIITFHFDGLSDLDTVRDFDFYTNDSIKSSDVGGPGASGISSGIFSTFSWKGQFKKKPALLTTLVSLTAIMFKYFLESDCPVRRWFSINPRGPFLQSASFLGLECRLYNFQTKPYG